MKSPKSLYSVFFLVILTFLAACGGANNTPVSAPQASPTEQASPTLTETATVAVIPTATACTNQAAFVSETVPDDTVFQPGDIFTKTWRLKNTGTCTWTTAYAIVFDHGDALTTATDVPLTGNVSPGQEAELSLDLRAPETPGTYVSHWKLRSDAGVLFGTGTDNTTFYAKIVVASPAAYSPYPTADCSTLGSAIQTAIVAPVTMNVVPFTNMLTQETGTACELYATGDGATFGMAGPLNPIVTQLQTLGWITDGQYGAAGPKGMTVGLRKGNALAVVHVGWEPSSDANCPTDQPIGACPLTPEQKLFTVKVDVAVK